MKRRDFLYAMATSPVVGALAVRMGRQRKYGWLNVETALARGYMPAKVFLDDREVGMDCTELDDVEGWVDLYKRDADGHVILVAGYSKPLRERRYGRVRFVPNQQGAPNA